MGGSHFLKVLHGRKEGLPPRLDYDKELLLHATLRNLIRAGLVRSAHDCSEGGLAVALAECCMSGSEPMGAAMSLEVEGRADVLLFNESQSRVLVSTAAVNAERLEDAMAQAGQSFYQLGMVGGDALTIAIAGQVFSWPVNELRDTWACSIGHLMEADTL